MREQNIFWLKNFTKDDCEELVSLLEDIIVEAAIVETNRRYIGLGALWSLQRAYREDSDDIKRNYIKGDFEWRLTLKQQSDKIKTIILLRWS